MLDSPSASPIGLAAWAMQMRSRYRTPASPQSQRTRTNRVRVGRSDMAGDCTGSGSLPQSAADQRPQGGPESAPAEGTAEEERPLDPEVVDPPAERDLGHGKQEEPAKEPDEQTDHSSTHRCPYP